MERFKIGTVVVVLALALCAMLDAARAPRARAEEGFQATLLVNTAGVVSSNGTASQTLLAIPNGYVAPANHRFWIGGMTIFNVDTVTHQPTLVSHYSRRVIWTAPLPAGGVAILDNTNMLFSDNGVTAHPEGIDFYLENGGGTSVGVIGQGYYK